MKNDTLKKIFNISFGVFMLLLASLIAGIMMSTVEIMKFFHVAFIWYTTLAAFAALVLMGIGTFYLVVIGFGHLENSAD